MMTSRIKQVLNLIAVLCLLTGLGISPAQAAPPDHFVTTWKTDNPGQSNNTSIIIPMYGGPYDVDWDNDGTFDEFGLYGSVTHDFGVAGTYTIRIDGSYTRIFFFDTGDKDKIVSLDQWGTQTWTSMRMAFYGCSNLEIPAADTPDFSAVTDMDYMFALAPLANPDTGGWDTSSVTNMNLMFFGASSANPDTSGWDTSSVTQMISMFESATAANPDTSGWDTSLVTDMNHMFFDATAANPDTSGWVTSSVTSMQSMFEGATAANPDTSGWDTSLVTTMHSMFSGATAANPDTSGWDTSSVDLMGSLFEGATAANPDTSGWNTSSVVNMNYMFSRASSANPDTSGWDTSSVTGMRYMFSYATSANPDTGGWDTSSVTNMRNMFYQATSANPDTSGWDMSRVTDTRYMFRGVTLSRPNYEGLLINWNAQALRSGLNFDGGNSTYCSNAAANARANMINADGWTITDGGPDCAGQTSPTVVTSSASSIGATGARLNGTADPNGASSSAWFEWGTSTAYGNVTSPQTNVGSGTSAVSYYFNLGALQCGTVYHFRAVAQNSGGTAYGNDRSFTTAACPTPHTVGGTVSGLSGSGLVLRNNGGDPLTISSDGSFTFNSPIQSGSTYSVTVASQPKGRTKYCSVANGSGTVNGANVTSVLVTCARSSYSVGGTVSGLSGSGLVLRNNGGDPLSISGNGSFTFNTRLAGGSGYSVTVATQPSGQNCIVSNGNGLVNGSNVTSVSVTCVNDTPDTFTVGGTASGLSGSGLVLRNSGGDPLTISGNGSFTFNTPLEDGSAYSVSVWIQPTGPDQTCSVANGTGTISGVDITNVSVTCVTDPGQEHVLLDSGFETGSKEGWSSKGKVSVDGFLAVDQYSLRHGKGAKSVYSLMTAGYEDVSVTMHLAATSLGSGDACFAEVSTDGGDSWMPVVTLQDGQDSGTFLSGTVFPPGAVNNLDVKLRFRSSGKRNPGYCYGDEVYVTGTLIGG